MPVPSARRFRAKVFRAMLSRPVRHKTCSQHVRTVASPGTRGDYLEFPFCFLATEEYTPECQAHHLYLAFRPRPEPERARLGHCRNKKAMICPIPQRFLGHFSLNLLRRPDWFRLPAAPIRLAAVNPLSAAASPQTDASSGGSPPTIVNSSGHVSPTARRFSPTAVASW